MTEKDKAAQRSTLIFQFGKLMAPLCELAEKTPPPVVAEYHIAVARGKSDYNRFTSEVNQFITIDDFRFDHLFGDILNQLYTLLLSMAKWAKEDPDDASRQVALKRYLGDCRRLTLEAIDRVPIEFTARMHEGKTPFSVYLSIRDAIGTARRRVHYFDRYLDTEFFHLYLRDLGRALELRLVTTKGKKDFGVANVSAVSRLAAGEFANYQLVECLPADLHDRNLRIDDTVFFLGTSIKDAGTQPTNFSPADSSAAGHAVLDRIMAKGTVVT